MRSSAIVDRIAALLERAVPFDRLGPEERRWLLREVVIEYFEPDEVILQHGRTEHGFLYIVESGFVRLVDRDTQRLIEECAEGEVFGSHGLIRGGPLPYEARAVEPTVCVLLQGRHFESLHAGHRDFAAFFDSELSLYTRSRKAPLDASSARLLFGTRLGELVHREPLTCEPAATAREVALLMRQELEDSVVVRRGGEPLLEAEAARTEEAGLEWRRPSWGAWPESRGPSRSPARFSAYSARKPVADA